MKAFDSLVELIQAQLRGDESSEELQRILGAAGLPDAMFAEIMPRLSAQQRPSPPNSDFNSNPSSVCSDTSKPGPLRLLVDWGMHPQVGYQARPCFMLLSAAKSYSQPEVTLEIDRDLDCLDYSPRIVPAAVGTGQWEFHAAFGLTTNQRDCRPGQYLIRIYVRFVDIDTTRARFFQSTIRLNIGGQGTAGPTLEIEGDGQSVVNLNGQDLRSFGRVVLRGSEFGIINIQSHGDTDDAVTKTSSSCGLTHEYELRIDHERHADIPTVAYEFERQRLESGTLVFDCGRRVTLMGKRRIQMGRSNDNDVVVRFLPRSEQNDRLSRNISRVHLVMSLQADGLRLADQSRTGTTVDFEAIESERLLRIEDCDGPLEMEMGIGADCLTAYQCQLQLFGPGRDTDNRKQIERDQASCNAVGETVPGLWRYSVESGIDSVALRRLNGSPVEPEHVCIFRQALIGASQSRCAITIHEIGMPPIVARILYIGRTYWLETLAESGLVRINDLQIPPLRLVPLAKSMRLMFGRLSCLFEEGT